MSTEVIERTTAPRRSRRFVPVLGLLFLSPLVGEYLLGNISIKELFALPFLVPMYGGGALLIRELARRTGRGWASILILGFAYGIVEAGLFDGSLFNPDYEGLELGAVYVPALGISAINAVQFLVGHAVWSITIPIVLVESFVPDRRTTPWLGKVGLAITAVCYVLGGLLIQMDSRDQHYFQTSWAQAAGALVVVGLLVVVAFRIRSWPGWGTRAADGPKQAPRPWLIGIGAFLAAGAFEIAPPQNWLGVAIAVGWLVIVAIVVTRLSWRSGWSDRHRIALTGGVLLTYAWLAFVLANFKGYTGALHLGGNIGFAVAAMILLALAVRRVNRVPE
jgi:hypothetical protein